MTDAGFVIAAYGVILGGLALYTLSLWRRIRSVADARASVRRARDGDEADEAR